MTDNRSHRAVVPLTAFALYGLVVAATLVLWFVFSPAEAGSVAVIGLFFVLLVQTGYLLLFTAGWLSQGLGRALPAPARMIASIVWTAYALVGLLTIAVFAPLQISGLEPTSELLAVLLAEFTLFALPTGLLFGFAAHIGARDADLEALRRSSIESGHALQRLSNQLRERSERGEMPEADRVARDLEAARAALAHTPLELARDLIEPAQPALAELGRLADQPWPEDPAEQGSHRAAIARQSSELRRALAPALVA
jgi:hypothetical protein